MGKNSVIVWSCMVLQNSASSSVFAHVSLPLDAMFLAMRLWCVATFFPVVLAAPDVLARLEEDTTSTMKEELFLGLSEVEGANGNRWKQLFKLYIYIYISAPMRPL